MRWAYGSVVAAVVAGAALVAGCERASTTARARTDEGGGSSYATRDSGGGAREGGGSDRGAGGYASRDGASGRSEGGSGDGYGERRARAATPMYKGEPLWSDNRKYTAQENATYHCGKSGPDIGASGYDDCLVKVHAFIDHPPSDVQTLTRANGDKLMYDPQANLFVVARKDGAPRTFFKPRTGAGYWDEQKQREADGGGYGRRSASRGGGSDEGSGSGV